MGNLRESPEPSGEVTAGSTSRDPSGSHDRKRLPVYLALMSTKTGKPSSMTAYQKTVVALLSFVQFTVVLDFMILSPLGPIVMPALHIGPGQFGLVVSAYAFSASVAGLLAAGFADKFDRKRLLLTFYFGFLAGTFLCGIAPSFHLLLAARVVTGLFAGVISSTSYAIVADLFPPSARGRAMGSIQSSFAASQVMGIPVALYLANHFGWNGPFLMIAGVGALMGIVIATQLEPIREHLAAQHDSHPMVHLWRTATNRRYLVGFAATMLVATGGFMLHPFASNFAVHNLGVPLDRLPAMYMAAGVVGMFVGPVMGRVADSFGKFRLLVVSSLAGMVTVWWWTGLGAIPLWFAIASNCLLFAIINTRQVATMAIIAGVPSPRDRGAYMAVSSSLQQFAGGISATVAGLLVVQSPSGRIENFQVLGWVVVAAMALTLAQMANVNRMVESTIVNS